MEENNLENQSNTEGFIQGETEFTIYENAQEHFSIAKIKIHFHFFIFKNYISLFLIVKY